MSPSLCLLRVGTGTWREAEFVSLEGRRPLPVGLDLALEDLGMLCSLWSLPLVSQPITSILYWAHRAGGLKMG